MKTIKKLSLVALAMILSVGMANAQLGIGLQGGYSLVHSNDKNAEGISGFHVGPTYDLAIQGPVGLHLGLLYNLNMKSSDKVLGAQTKHQWHSLDIPVRANFEFPVPMVDGLSLSAFAGPNFNIGLANQTILESKLGDVKTDLYNIDLNKDGKSDFSRFNVQLGFGVAAKYKTIGVRASYDFGMINMNTLKVAGKNLGDVKFNGFKLGVFFSL